MAKHKLGWVASKTGNNAGNHHPAEHPIHRTIKPIIIFISFSN